MDISSFPGHRMSSLSLAEDKLALLAPRINGERAPSATPLWSVGVSRVIGWPPKDDPALVLLRPSLTLPLLLPRRVLPATGRSSASNVPGVLLLEVVRECELSLRKEGRLSSFSE